MNSNIDRINPKVRHGGGGVNGNLLTDKLMMIQHLALLF